MSTPALAGCRILVVDDDPHLCELVEMTLADEGADTTACGSADAALEHLARAEYDVVLTDIEMEGMDGLQLCEHIASTYPDARVVILSGRGDFDRAIKALRAGAFDFMPKPLDAELLAIALQRAVRDRRLLQEVSRLRRTVETTHGFGDLLYGSPAMARLADLLERVSDSDASVLVVGESGTGKELVARALHRAGPRRDGPFVAINCAAMPETLLEGELFGWVRGAFTDARAPRTGLFAQADRGTLFLDEIGDMPLSLQPKLLRALQERVVRPIGGDALVRFDARIIAATNQNLEAAVERGRFREDLYFRLAVVEASVPPLRTRGNDVLLLAQHFMERYAAKMKKEITGLAPAAAQRLLAYSWPGNVREVQNCIEAAVTLARKGEIGVADLPARIRRVGAASVPVADGPSPLLSLDEVERRHILRVLDAVKGSRTLAARTLGLDRKTLYRKLQQYRVES